jgi:hypothetical protein
MESNEIVARTCICCASSSLQSSPAVLMPFIAHRAFGWRPVVIDQSWGLKTIPQGIAYSVCNSLGCSQCGVVFLDIRFSESEMRNLYSDYRGDRYVALRDYYEPGYRAINEQLTTGVNFIDAVERFLSSHISGSIRVLDWGGDTGKNTPFRNLAEKIDVYDLSDSLPVPGVRRVTLSEASEGAYSLIVCMQVLEHVPYPETELRTIRRFMTSGTVLYVEVPCEELMLVESVARHERKRYWHEHINFFSERSLALLFERSGFRILELSCTAVSVLGRQSRIFQAALAIS